MEKDEKEYTGDYCKFLESEIVQGIYHRFCLNQRMHEINKVKNNKKLPCIGARCGLAVLDKENNQGKADYVHDLDTVSKLSK